VPQAPKASAAPESNSADTISTRSTQP
jgi:hypothetical protein